MKKSIEQIAIIGLGKFGMTVAKQLSNYNCDVLAIDSDENLIEEAVPFVTKAIQINALEADALEACGIKGFDIAIIGIGDNIESSLMVALTLKDLGIPKIVAKARDEKHAKLLEMIGVTRIVQPEIDSALKLVNSITTKYVIEKTEMGRDFSMLEIEAPKDWINKNFGELALRQKFSFNVVCVKRGEEVVFPTANTEVKEGDTLVILAHNESLEALEKLY
ncbi:MAG: TrkA family potassium uptake protein [Clostridia bacterium]|nr:TrkA family potassium uptake protein [Clostridia bacterium]